MEEDLLEDPLPRHPQIGNFPRKWSIFFSSLRVCIQLLLRICFAILSVADALQPRGGHVCIHHSYQFIRAGKQQKRAIEPARKHEECTKKKTFVRTVRGCGQDQDTKRSIQYCLTCRVMRTGAKMSPSECSRQNDSLSSPRGGKLGKKSIHLRSDQGLDEDSSCLCQGSVRSTEVWLSREK